MSTNTAHQVLNLGRSPVLPDTTTLPKDVRTHVYARDAIGIENDSLSKIASQISAGSLILDVGTGSGGLARALSKVGNCTVDGITYNEEEAALALPFYRNLRIVDLEREPLEGVLPEKAYDVIVCADVLEHLRNAPEVLKALKRFLKPDGALIISIPNVTHLGVLLSLLFSRFVRTHEGLLDSTHVHFLDRHALHQLITCAGYSVVKEDSVVKNLVETEFAQLDYLALPSQLRSFLLCLPDSQVYQFVWTMTPTSTLDVKSQPSISESPTARFPSFPEIESTPRFQVQIHVDRGQGFSAQEVLTAFGYQSEGRQLLRFNLVNASSVVGLRLDLADRPGIIEFFTFTAKVNGKDIVWQWNGDWASNQTYSQCEWSGAIGWLGGRIVNCTGSDPWVAIPVTFQMAPGSVELEVELTCPQPASASVLLGLNPLALKQGLASLHLEIEALQKLTQDRVQTLVGALAHAQSMASEGQRDVGILRADLIDVYTRLNAKSVALDNAQREMANFQSVSAKHLADMHEQLQAKSVALDNASKAAAEFQMVCANDLALAHQNLAFRDAQLNEILNSTSWKLTAGVRWLKRLFRPNQGE
jgi:2-polyprenyl-3-methyl-5-hydroxy-6-metoxy-1,4-benzoquinol methylase